MLVIELDGGQHGETINEDATRTKILNRMGYEVIRFWNNDIFSNLDGVLDCIKNSLV